MQSRRVAPQGSTTTPRSRIGPGADPRSRPPRPVRKQQTGLGFVLIRDRAQLEKISHVWQGAGHIANAAAAVGLVAPYSDDLRLTAVINYDLGQAAMSMMIAAADIEIGSRTASVHDYELASEILGLPEDRRLTWLAKKSRGSPTETNQETRSSTVRGGCPPRSMVTMIRAVDVTSRSFTIEGPLDLRATLRPLHGWFADDGWWLTAPPASQTGPASHQTNQGEAGA